MLVEFTIVDRNGFKTEACSLNEIALQLEMAMPPHKGETISGEFHGEPEWENQYGELEILDVHYVVMRHSCNGDVGAICNGKLLEWRESSKGHGIAEQIKAGVKMPY